jgi:hypothetical protein
MPSDSDLITRGEAKAAIEAQAIHGRVGSLRVAFAALDAVPAAEGRWNARELAQESIDLLFTTPSGEQAVKILLLNKETYELWRWNKADAMEIVRTVLARAVAEVFSPPAGEKAEGARPENER